MRNTEPYRTPTALVWDIASGGLETLPMSYSTGERRSLLANLRNLTRVGYAVLLRIDSLRKKYDEY